MDFIPLTRRILIRDLPESTSSNIILLESTNLSEHRKSHVHVVGKDVTEVKAGDTVLTSKHYGRKVELDGVDYREYPVDEVLAVYE